MRACVACGAVNSAEARFCANCGVALTPTCGRCGAELPGQVRFCPNCGAPVSGEVEATPGQERKLVTVLFADVTGSTGLGERLDPERFKEVMDAYFEAMRREIEAEGGTVEKFIGDAVMAAFGVPSAHEDDPTRALRAALRMRQALEKLNETRAEVHDLTLEMRVGVSMGEVVAVISPRPGEGMITGDASNVAARLEQSAEPGQILVSERAARAARGFDFTELGPLKLKGKARTVEVFELMGEEPGPKPTAPRFRAPMVGRDREMALLQTVYDRVASEGHPHLVTIYGDPGVGKSRLVAEFADWADRQEAPPRFLKGRCLPYGAGVTYWPLAEILKQHAKVLDSDPPRLALSKVEKVGREFLSPDLSPDPARAIAALCFTVGLEHPDASFADLDPRQIRLEAYAAWRSYFSALSRPSPAIVLIEDIHWADPAMLDLLEELADRVEGPLLFLCPSRPELTGRRPGWGGGRWNFSSILLEPLTLHDSELLIDFLLEDEKLPEAVRARVLERAGGNPFFLEEIVRHLLEEQAAGATTDPARPIDMEQVEIPDTVQGVLAARMDLLAGLEKRALQSAAVVGRVFWIGPIARLLPEERESLEAALRRLEDRGLILTRLSSSMGGEREYIFKHILTRDVAYESLSRRERAAAHAEVAKWIEESTGERQREFVELLAHHYAEAYRSVRDQSRPDAEHEEGLRAKAFGYTLQASEEARSKLVLDKAGRMADAALSLATIPTERSQALEVLGETYYLDVEGDLAWASFREAIDVRLPSAEAQDSSIARLCARALEVATRGRGAMRSRLSQEEAEPYLELGLAHAPVGDSQELARLLMVKSFWPYSFRDVDFTDQECEEAREAGERAAEMALRLGLRELASGALDGVGTSFWFRDLYGRMGSVIERRLELARSIEDPWEAGDIYSMAAWVAYHVGRYRDALSLANEGFERSRVGAPALALQCVDWRAVARCRLGDWGGLFEEAALAQELLGERGQTPPGFAADHVAAAAFVHEAQGDRAASDRLLQIVKWLEQAEERPSPAWAVWRALVMARRGLFDDARAYVDQASPVAQYARGHLMEARCDVLAEQGAWEEVPEFLSLARGHAEEAGLAALPLYADRLDGRMILVEGDPERAVGLLERARSGFTALGASWERACTELHLAEALLRTGRGVDGAQVLEACMPVFEALRSDREAAAGRDLLDRLG